MQRRIQRQEQSLLGRANPLLRALRPSLDRRLGFAHDNVRTAISGRQQRMPSWWSVNEEERPRRWRNEAPIAVSLSEEVVVVSACASLREQCCGIADERLNVPDADRDLVHGASRRNADLAIGLHVRVADSVRRLSESDAWECPWKLPVN
jgi:hypothetical protein